MFSIITAKSLLLKSSFITLSILLAFTSIFPANVSANTSEVTTENAIKIFEALDNTSIIQEDGTVLFNENQLENELKDNPEYENLKQELENSGLLTNEITSESSMIMVARADNRNPKWVAARDACAKKYLSDTYGVPALGVTITAIFSGDFRKAVAEFAKRGAKITVPGLITVYVHMNYKCIKEANSKHSVY